jgi:predicted glycoside hydrolase/deacetylase ChbG (UPF0249 family)
VKNLIITADDFGAAVEVNQAVELAHRDGILSAASLMVSGAAANDGVQRARTMPQLRVGLHLVLVDGKPVLPAGSVPPRSRPSSPPSRPPACASTMSTPTSISICIPPSPR